MTLILALLVLTIAAAAATIHTMRDGGHGSPPRSHERDSRFLPPASLLH